MQHSEVRSADGCRQRVAPRPMAWVFAGLLMCLVAACTSTSTDDGGEHNAKAVGVRLQASARIAERPQPGPRSRDLKAYPPGPGLLIEYRLSSDRSEPFVAVDHLPQSLITSSSTLGDADPLRVVVDDDGPPGGEEGTVTLSKRTVAADVDYTPTSQGTVVSPGDTITGRAFAPLPLGTAYDARGDRTSNGPQSWRLCIGVTDAMTGARLLPDGVHAEVPAQGREPVVCTDPLPLPG